MMLSNRLAIDSTLGFKAASLFTIYDRLMVVAYDMSSNFGRSVLRAPSLFRGYTSLTGQLFQLSGRRDFLDLVLG